MRKILFLTLGLIAGTVRYPASAAPGAVTISQDDNLYTLANGSVTAQVSKISGNLTSLKYKGLELMGYGAGYWEQDPSAARRYSVTVTIDPAKNGGERGEVAIKGFSDGTIPLGNGPGGSTLCDIELRYALGRSDSGLYTYAIYDHPTNYPATQIGESRFCAKLNDDLFDWMTVDANRNMKLISTYDWNHGTQLNMKEVRRMNTGIYKGQAEHKYDYSANQFDVRAWGWSSSAKHVGLWFVNPSVEYLSGGPTKVELSAHRDATFNTNALDAPAPPTLLNYWRGTHYGGSVCAIAQTDAWTKVVGPFLIYCNSGQSPDALWQDALKQAKKEADAWPYDWVVGVDYPRKNQRSAVKGQLVLQDSQAPKLKFGKLLVGLSAPDYMPPVMRGGRGGRGGRGRGGRGGGAGAAGNTVAGRGADPGDMFGGGFDFGFGGPQVVTWQNDAKHYEFWVRGDNQGRLAIPKVRPGTTPSTPRRWCLGRVREGEHYRGGRADG